MSKHHSAAHDDETWRGYFRRWHAGEPVSRLIAEAGVVADTFHVHARRLGMRRKDLPPDHPGRRAVPAYADRSDDWRHPNSRLTEGGWRALFRLRDAGVPDVVLAVRFGVHVTTIGSQAKARGLSRDAAGVARDPAAAAAALADAATRAELTAGVGEDAGAGEGADGYGAGGSGAGAAGGAAAAAAYAVAIDPDDPAATRAAFDASIAAAAAGGDFARVAAICAAKEKVVRAVLGTGGAGSLPPRSCAAAEGALARVEGAGADGAGRRLALRPAQRAPEGDWSTWLFLGGRGAGKTLAGAAWLADMAGRVGPGGRLALIGPTLHDVREVMIEGVSGLLSLERWAGGARPVYEPTRRRVCFPNGAVAQAFSAEDPDSLRGPQFSAAWADEFCAWRNGGEVLALLRMGLRLPLPGAAVVGPSGPPDPTRPGASRAPTPEGGARRGAQAASARDASDNAPRLCVTTTPRPTAALRRLRAEASCVETRAATRDNAAHLAPGFLAGLEALYGGTRRAAQELDGQVVELEGALFTADMLARAREAGAGDEGGGFDRVVVAVDPCVTADGDACGIVAAGRKGDRAVVLADRSARGLSPEGWARRAVRTAEEFGARAIVAEVNQGGDLVRSVLVAAGSQVKLRAVRATRGKRVRAEPVAALYEQGRVGHAGTFAQLEEELMAMGGPDEAGESLDRADALVWAITDLLIDRTGAGPGPRIRQLDWSPPPSGISARLW